MKKLFKRFAPLLLALVMVLGSCLTVSAASYSDDVAKNCYDTCLEKVKDLGLDPSVYKYSVVFYEEPFGSPPGYYALIFNVPVYIDGSSYSYNGSVFSYVRCSYIGGHYSFLSGSTDTLTTIGANYLKRSSYDVYSSSSSSSPIHEADTDFFPIPPTPAPPLVGAVQGAAPEEALTEVILLIPLLILYLVGYRGLQKGLQILSTLLRRA